MDIEQRISAQTEKGCPFVIFKKPDAKCLEMYFSKVNLGLISAKELSEPGYICRPFSPDEKLLFLPLKDCSYYQLEFSADRSSFESKPITRKPNTDYKRAFSVCKELLVKKKLDKLVLARKKRLKTQLKPSEIFQRIAASYPEAYCCMFWEMSIGYWLLASPEILIKVDDYHCELMSLAGTKSEPEEQWTAKEYEEQQIVTNYLFGLLDGFSENLSVGKRKELKAGRLRHLCNVVSADLKSSTNLFDLIERVHPTPAVCGQPKNDAYKLIRKIEQAFDREYYSGYIGEYKMRQGIEKEGYVDMRVNIRSMKLQNEIAEIYVGGGLTSSSELNSEWRETEVKGNTLLNLL